MHPAKQSSPTRRSPWAQVQRLAPLALALLLASPSAGCSDDQPECMQYRFWVGAAQNLEGQGLVVRMILDNPGDAEDPRQAETWASYCFLGGQPVHDLPDLHRTGALCLAPGIVGAPGRLEAWVVPNDDWCERAKMGGRISDFLEVPPRATESIMFQPNFDPTPVFNLFVE